MIFQLLRVKHFKMDQQAAVSLLNPVWLCHPSLRLGPNAHFQACSAPPHLCPRDIPDPAFMSLKVG